MKRTRCIQFCLFFLFIMGYSITTSAQSNSEDTETDETEMVSDSTETKKDSSKMIAFVVKGCDKIDGLFPMYQDTATGKLYMEVASDKIGKEFIHLFHAENGSLNAGWVKGSYGWESILKIHKYYDRIEFIGQNPHYYHDPANPVSKAANADINNPVVSMSKIVASSETNDTFLIEADAMFLTEALAQLKFLPPPGSGQKNPFKIGSLSSNKTRYSRIKNYPNNIAVEVDYVYENKYPTNWGLQTITDPRYTTIKVQHNLIEMPDNDYEPRYDDPRIGYFTTQVTDQTTNSVTPYRDLIHRWHLKKKDPNAAISEPVKPIVFWMENTTPTNLRPVIKKAVESWNIAFEKAGFKNAVVVKQQPDDADWEAGDIRYNVLRWTAAPMMGSAWGPSFVNPRTGEIIAADIMLDILFVTGLKTMDKLFGVDSKSLDQMMFDHMDTETSPRMRHHECTAAHHKMEQMVFGKYVGSALGYSEEDLKKIEEEMITELLLHEVGHTLGLNHNFKSSQLRSPEEMNNKALTEKEGLSGSVMDYNPFNFAMSKEEQGQFLTTVPGPYDLWAIEFGYTTDDDLDAILSRSTEPELVFGNDADAMGSPGWGIDPTIIRWDMSSDVMQYGENRIKLCEKTMAKLKDILTDEGQSYQELLVGYYTVLGNYNSALNLIKHYVGGVNIERSFIGQENAGVPFTPVSYQEQKRAMNMLVKHAFSPTAYMTPNKLYKYLQVQRRGFDHWGQPEDPKIHDRITFYQRRILSHLLHPTVLKRMTDSGLYGNAYSVAAMMGDLTDGVFNADLKSNVNTIRQNLQHVYVDGLLSALENGRYDSVAKSAILNEVLDIQKMMKDNKGKSIETKAHRKHVMLKIDKALDTD